MVEGCRAYRVWGIGIWSQAFAYVPVFTGRPLGRFFLFSLVRPKRILYTNIARRLGRANLVSVALTPQVPTI